jgi:hypothetical protein
MEVCFTSKELNLVRNPTPVVLNNFVILLMHTARTPPADPTPAAMTAAFSMHAGHIFSSYELLIQPRLSGAAMLLPVA